MQTFTSQIRLEKIRPRTSELIQLLNNMHISSNAMMVVLDAFQISGTEVTGNIQLTHNELKVTFTTIAPSMNYLGMFASKFNMCSTHCCDIKFAVVEPAKLEISFTPPSETQEEIIRNFFEMTSWSFDLSYHLIGNQKRNTSCEVFLFHFIIILLILKSLQFLELHKLLI